jgi:hypothetical protein
MIGHLSGNLHARFVVRRLMAESGVFGLAFFPFLLLYFWGRMTWIGAASSPVLMTLVRQSLAILVDVGTLHQVLADPCRSL